MGHCSHVPATEADNSSARPDMSQASQNASPRFTLRNRRDPSALHTGSPRPAPKRAPGATAPPGAGSRLGSPRLRTGPSKHTITSTSPSGIKKKPERGKEKKKRKKKKKKERADESDVMKWLGCEPGELMAAVVKMHEYYASSVNDLREELERERVRCREERRVVVGGLRRHGEWLRGVLERFGEEEEEVERWVEGDDDDGGDGGFEVRAGEEMDVDCGGTDDVDGCGDDGGIGEDEAEGGDEADDTVTTTTTTSHLNMEVPPTPTVDRQPIRSTGLKAIRRRPGTRTPLPVRQRAGISSKPTPRPLTGEDVPRQDDAGAHNHNDDEEKEEEEEEDEALKILDGAPRLRALLRQQHGITSSSLERRPRPEPVYLETVPDEDEADEYRPCSPSESSGSSSPSVASSASWAPGGSSSPAPRVLQSNPSTQKLPSAAAPTSAASSSSPPPSSPIPPLAAKGPQEAATAAASPPPSSTPPPQPPSQSPSPSKPRYSTPRHTTLKRTNSGPQYAGQFTFRRMGRTVLSVWNEYKVDSNNINGKPFRCIESLEKEYGTYWRTGSVPDIKYASNYVGVRKKIVDFVEGLCEGGRMTPEEACAKLDERVDGRLQVLITVLRKGQDPFEKIPVRGGGSVSPRKTGR